MSLSVNNMATLVCLAGACHGLNLGTSKSLIQAHNSAVQVVYEIPSAQVVRADEIPDRVANPAVVSVCMGSAVRNLGKSIKDNFCQENTFTWVTLADLEEDHDRNDGFMEHMLAGSEEPSSGLVGPGPVGPSSHTPIVRWWGLIQHHNPANSLAALLSGSSATILATWVKNKETGEQTRFPVAVGSPTYDTTGRNAGEWIELVKDLEFVPGPTRESKAESHKTMTRS